MAQQPKMTFGQAQLKKSTYPEQAHQFSAFPCMTSWNYIGPEDGSSGLLQFCTCRQGTEPLLFDLWALPLF